MNQALDAVLLKRAGELGAVNDLALGTARQPLARGGKTANLED